MNYIVYKLHCMEYEYVGKTKDFNFRKKKHEKTFYGKDKIKRKYKVYRTIRDNYSWDLVYFEIIEDGLTKEEARVMEDVYIRKLDPQIKLNTQNGIKTAEDAKIQRKKYNIKNREKIKNYKKEKIPCKICNTLHCRNHLKRHQNSRKCKKIKKNLLKYYKRWRENIKKA